MIIDSFLFFNETDLLEKRLKYLDDIVDYFLIVEGTCTFSGKDRDLVFPKNTQRYKNYLHKILYFPFVMDKTGLDYSIKPNAFDQSHAAWKTESGQRNYLATGAKLFKDDDIIILNDVDEIPNKHIIKSVTQLLSSTNLKIALDQTMFYYNFNKVQHQVWRGPIITTIKHFVDVGPENIRSTRNNIPYVNNGGWHLSYFFSAEKIQEKLVSFAHQELNKEEFTNLDIIRKRVERGDDIAGRNIKTTDFDVNSLPEDFRTIFV